MRLVISSSSSWSPESMLLQPTTTITKIINPTFDTKHSKSSQKDAPFSSISINKRTFNLSFAATALSFVFLRNVDKSIAAQEEEEQLLELQRFTDSVNGFTLLKPNSWIQVDKAGATALFEEPNKGSSNNLGVVVTPVRLDTLEQFGTPQFVADKLIQAEKRKESTKDAEVIKVAERSSKDGLQVYEFEYTLDSTRGGMKRIFSAAFVASKKLYLLNITHSDKPESPLDNHTRTLLELALHSFDTTTSI